MWETNPAATAAAFVSLMAFADQATGVAKDSLRVNPV